MPAGFHERRLRLLLEGEPDFVAIETQPRLDEAVSIVSLLDGIDGWVTFACGDGERTWHGERIEDAVAAVAAFDAVAAVGVNCTAPEYVDELLARARTVTDLPLVAYPNAGRTYDAASKTWSGDASPLGLPATPRSSVDAAGSGRPRSARWDRRTAAGKGPSRNKCPCLAPDRGCQVVGRRPGILVVFRGRRPAAWRRETASKRGSYRDGP